MPLYGKAIQAYIKEAEGIDNFAKLNPELCITKKVGRTQSLIRVKDIPPEVLLVASYRLAYAMNVPNKPAFQLTVDCLEGAYRDIDECGGEFYGWLTKNFQTVESLKLLNAYQFPQTRMGKPKHTVVVKDRILQTENATQYYRFLKGIARDFYDAIVTDNPTTVLKPIVPLGKKDAETQTDKPRVALVFDKATSTGDDESMRQLFSSFKHFLKETSNSGVLREYNDLGTKVDRGVQINTDRLSDEEVQQMLGLETDDEDELLDAEVAEALAALDDDANINEEPPVYDSVAKSYQDAATGDSEDINREGTPVSFTQEPPIYDSVAKTEVPKLTPQQINIIRGTLSYETVEHLNTKLTGGQILAVRASLGDMRVQSLVDMGAFPSDVWGIYQKGKRTSDAELFAKYAEKLDAEYKVIYENLTQDANLTSEQLLHAKLRFEEIRSYVALQGLPPGCDSIENIEQYLIAEIVTALN